MKLADFRRAADGEMEARRLHARFNETCTDYPRHATVHALFAAQAAVQPEAVALLHGEQEYSYRQVDQASNRFARFLVAEGLRREEPVAVLLGSRFELVSALVGILKAGGAYMPIEPDAPFDRVRAMLDEAGVRILVSEKRHIRMLNSLQWECPCLDLLFCADSHDVRAEPESTGEMMREAIWDHVGATAFDDISGGGWTSSYTGEWLDRTVMDEYGDNVRAKLQSHLNGTTRVLEIGCGSGISLLRLAPLVGHYEASDLSRVILERTAREVRRAGLGNVSLHHLAAHETSRIEAGDFDVVILNSVVQCFSGWNYFRQVVRQAIDRMADRGILFLGNLWDLDRKANFVRSLTEFRDAHPGEGHRTKLDRTEEFFVSREMLEDLRHDCPEIAGIECSFMLGTARSELSDFGYDALLRIDRDRRAALPLRPRRKVQHDLRALQACSDEPVPETTGPEGLAYVMHTSGTSGRPKGVMVEHRGIVRLVRETDYIRLGPETRMLQTGSLAFDASTLEIWGPLLNGGTLCLPPPRAILDPAELARLISRHRVNTMFLTTGLFNQHAGSDPGIFAGLDQLVVGGERASATHMNRVRERHPHLVLINGYGPTENTTFTTCHRVERSYAGDIPIGRPIANTEVLILDSGGAPVPVGVSGEICAAGDGLARGYLNDPELTARKFVRHPWDPARRIYRTGDLGLWRADGTIEYLGRNDDQIKIRGYRIEPAEVEAQLLADPRVSAALVVGCQVGSSGQALVAYVAVGAEAADEVAEALREQLRRSLPDYMIPSHIVPLARLPLNANGKVDRHALPDPVGSAARAARREPPATETERQLAAVWREVLGVDEVGATENFFEAGGHSLKVTRAVALIERELGIAVPLAVFFARPTIRDLAEAVLDRAKFGIPGFDDALVPLSPHGEDPPLFAFPPGTGDALGYVQLASLLPCRVFGFNFIEAPSRLRDYAELIERTAPDGPCVLFGYSSGGNLAHAAAREVEARGRRVAAIVMIDSARKMQRMPIAEQQIDRVARQFLADPSMAPYLASPVLREKALRTVRHSLRYVGEAVDTGIVDADIHVLSSADSITEYRDPEGRLLISLDAWAELSRGKLRVWQGVGDHNHMLAQPHLDRNAEMIREILRRCR